MADEGLVDQHIVLGWLASEHLLQYADTLFDNGWVSLSKIQNANPDTILKLLQDKDSDAATTAALREKLQKLKSVTDFTAYRKLGEVAHEVDEDEEEKKVGFVDPNQGLPARPNQPSRKAPGPPKRTSSIIQDLHRHQKMGSISQFEKDHLSEMLMSGDEQQVRQATQQIEAIPEGPDDGKGLVDRLLPQVDMMVYQLQAIDNKHPFSGIVCDTVLMLREVLSCWNDQRLHTGALESVSNRVNRVSDKLQEYRDQAPIVFRSQDLEVMSEKVKGKWHKLTRIHTKLNYLFFVNANLQQLQAIDLREVVGVTQLQKSEFIVSFRDGDVIREPHFRARDTQVWVDLFAGYLEQNEGLNALAGMPESDKVRFCANDVFSPYNEANGVTSDQFLLVTDEHMKEKDRQTKSADDPTNGGRKGILDVFEVAAIEPLDSPDVKVEDKASLEFLKFEYAIEVNLPAAGRGLGRGGKMRHQPRIIIYKKGAQEEQQVFFYKDFLDFKLRQAEWGCELCFRVDGTAGEYFEQRFVFQNNERFKRFCSLLQAFPPLPFSSDAEEASTPKLLNQEALDKLLGGDNLAEMLVTAPGQEEFPVYDPTTQPDKMSLPDLETRLTSTSPGDFWFRRITLINQNTIYKDQKRSLYELLEKAYQKGDITVKTNILSILNEWAVCYFTDLKDKKTRIMKIFLSEVPSKKPEEVAALAAIQVSLRENLPRIAKNLEIREKAIRHQLALKKRPLSARPIEEREKELREKRNICEFSAFELALVMYYLDSNTLLAANVREFVGERWKKKDKETEAFHVLDLIESGDQRVWWVCTQIMLQKGTKKRTRTIALMIDTAWESYIIGNWYTVSSIVIALLKPPILRLKKAWKIEESTKERWEHLKVVTARDNNYLYYRQNYYYRATELKLSVPVLLGPLATLTLDNKRMRAIAEAKLMAQGSGAMGTGLGSPGGLTSANSGGRSPQPSVLRPNIVVDDTAVPAATSDGEEEEGKEKNEKVEKNEKDRGGRGTIASRASTLLSPSASQSREPSQTRSGTGTMLSLDRSRSRKRLGGDDTADDSLQGNVRLTEIPDMRVLLNDLYKIETVELWNEDKSVMQFHKFAKNWTQIHEFVLLAQVLIKEDRKHKPFKIDKELLGRYKVDNKNLFTEDELYLLSHRHEAKAQQK